MTPRRRQVGRVDPLRGAVRPTAAPRSPTPAAGIVADSDRRRSRRDDNQIQDDSVCAGGEPHDGDDQSALARPGDEAELTAMMHELAEFEHAADQCTVTENQMRTALFGDSPHGIGARRRGGRPARGCALWYLSFSTWDGRSGHLPGGSVRAAGSFAATGSRRRLLGTLARGVRRPTATRRLDVGGSGLERRRDRAVRRRRRQAAVRLDQLPGVAGSALSEFTESR